MFNKTYIMAEIEMTRDITLVGFNRLLVTMWLIRAALSLPYPGNNKILLKLMRLISVYWINI